MISDILVNIFDLIEIDNVENFVIAVRDPQVYKKLVIRYKSELDKHPYEFTNYCNSLYSDVFAKTFNQAIGFESLPIMQIPMMYELHLQCFPCDGIKRVMIKTLRLQYPVKVLEFHEPTNPKSDMDYENMNESIKHSGSYYVFMYSNNEECVIYTHLPLVHPYEKGVVSSVFRENKIGNSLLENRYGA